jgi:hypothetical protein
MIQTTYLEGVGYCEQRHYNYPYTRQINNNFSKKNWNEAWNIWPYNHNEFKFSSPMAIQPRVATN